MPLPEKLIAFLQMGGPVVWILALFSTIAITIIVIKLIQFSYMKAEKQAHIELALQHWANGDSAQALIKLNRKRPQDEVVSLAMNGLLNQQKESRLREELQRVATNRLNQLRAYFRPLEVIAALSPLLGLLGTVLGMIVAFQQMEAAGSQVDPSVLSGGIWQALLTTAVGLAVAIPVLTAHNWMERKVERIADNLNDAVTRVFTTQPEKLVENKPKQDVRNAA